MLVQIETVLLALSRYAQQTRCIHCQHQHHRDSKSSQSNHRAADSLSNQYLCTAAVEQASQRSRVIGSDGTSRSISSAGKQAQRERSPDAADAVNRNRADRIVNAQLFQQVDAEHDDHASDDAEKNRARRANPVAWAGDGDQSSQEAVRREASVPLLARHVREKHRSQAGCAGRESGVGGDSPDTLEVHRGERAARVESIPAKPQDQTAGDRDGQIVRQHRCAAITLELAAEAWTQHDRAGQSDEAADRVNHCRSGEVMEAHAQLRYRSVRRCPSVRASHPDPTPSGR